MPDFEPHSSARQAHSPLVHAVGWFGAFLNYLKARAELAFIEVREAGSHYGVAVGMFAGAAILILFGYVFLMLAAVFGIALLFDHPHAWILVMGVNALLHIGGAVALIMMARKRLKTGPFACTKEETKKDQLWLHPPEKKN